jgi:predicted 3-demethylubiquinone-9 3-methyltransferase (glyoxalase superfamily)
VTVFLIQGGQRNHMKLSSWMKSISTMASKMNNPSYPCLWFDGKAKDAADFYCTVFENSKVSSCNAMTVMFELEGRRFMALNGGPMFKINPSISFFVTNLNEENIEEKWKRLSDGGEILMPLDTYPWSSKYGWCKDKYGVNWQLTLQKSSGPDTIFPFLMFIKQNTGKAKEALDYYTTIFSNSEVKFVEHFGKDDHDVEGYIKNAQFILNGNLFGLMENSGAHEFNFSEGVSIVIECETQEEIDYYWSNLTAQGGEESMCGWLKDRYGVSWQIVPSILSQLMSNPDSASKVTGAFMKMKKFNIAELIEAAGIESQN